MAPAGMAPMLAPFAAYAKSAARSARAQSQRVAVRRAVAFRSWPVSTVRCDAAICPKSGLCHEDAEVSRCVRDEGGPFGAALEEEAPNNHELLRTKAAVVKRHGKGAAETASCEDERDERK